MFKQQLTQLTTKKGVKKMNKRFILVMSVLFIMALCLSSAFAEKISLSSGYTVSTVGGASPDYATLYDAANDFNTKVGGLPGDWMIYINGNLTETNNVPFGNLCNGYKITIKPLVTATITFGVVVDNPGISGNLIIGSNNTTSLNDGLFKMDGFTVDGSITSGTQDLTIKNTSAAIANSYLVRVFGDSDNVVVKNCIMTNLSTGSSPYCLQFTSRLTTGGTIGLHPDASVVENCNLSAVASTSGQVIGYGNSGTCPAGIAQNNIIIRNNTLLGRTRTIYMVYTANATISNNTIRLNQASTGFYSSVVGHWGANSAPFTMNVYNNVFDQVTTANQTAANGLIVLEIDQAGTYNVYNNMFGEIVDTGSSAAGSLLLGAIRGFAAAATYNIYNNSIFMKNNTGLTGMSVDSCYAIGLNTGNGTNGPVYIKNNIVRMEQKGGVCFRKTAVVGPGTNDIDNNVWSADTANGAFVASFTQGIGLTRATTLADWLAIQKCWDRNSQELNPRTSTPGAWISATDLHFSDITVTGLNAGQILPFTGVDKDIDGNNRNTVNPTPGCDELSMFDTTTAAFVSISSKATDSYGVIGQLGKLTHIVGAVYSPTSLDTTAAGLMQRFIVDPSTGLGYMVEGVGVYATATSYPGFARGDSMDVIGVVNSSLGMAKILPIAIPTNAGASGYTFTPLAVTDINSLSGFDATAASGGELYESKPCTLSNVTVLKTCTFATTNGNSMYVEIGDGSSNIAGGYYKSENIPFRWYIAKGTNMYQSLMGKVLVRGHVIPSLTGVVYQVSTSGKAGYIFTTVDGADQTIGSEVGDIMSSPLNWIWSTASCYSQYKAANAGSDVYNGVSIITSVYWPDLTRTSDEIRNFAYVAGRHQVYINSRDTVAPAIIDAANGSVLGSLDTTGIGGGTYALARLGGDNLDRIYGVNLQTGASALKIYRWDDEISAPTLIVNTTLAAGQRTGDGFSVQNMTNGNL